MTKEIETICNIISELALSIDTLSTYSYQKSRSVNLPSLITKAKVQIEVALSGFQDLEESP